MTPQRVKEVLPFLTAYANGQEVENRYIHDRPDGHWYSVKDLQWSKPDDVPGLCTVTEEAQ